MKPKPAAAAAASDDMHRIATRVLSVRCEGCTMSAPLSADESLDDAVWSLLRRFNYDPTRYKGWIRVTSSPGTVAVGVYRA